ncbi:hypothetical protein DZF91_16835 [Actinomadura logoneensis]|uniref:Tetratricopeptide repeat protein n=1 Tax=Actinomadura logoneensis TaxID=2293572 RepID=A0A372JKG1_9ACTN|nr:hypothetical protein [Actinomadura logoneensis]RFU40485.1 hypothetical protein DZF91_16835 [Actinomadura logoneensis]
MTTNTPYTPLATARRLHVLGDWDHAAALLDADQSTEALELKAEILYERLLFQLEGMDAAADAIAALDPETPQARLLAARLAYTRLMFKLDPLPDDYETAEGGYRFASSVRETHGWAEFHWGALLDNIREDADTAKVHYDKALEAAVQEGDSILESIVLRHVAWHVIEAGNREEGLQMLRRSLHLRCAVGLRPQIAAAQLLLATELPKTDPERTTLIEAAQKTANDLNLTWVKSALENLPT